MARRGIRGGFSPWRDSHGSTVSWRWASKRSRSRVRPWLRMGSSWTAWMRTSSCVSSCAEMRCGVMPQGHCRTRAFPACRGLRRRDRHIEGAVRSSDGVVRIADRRRTDPDAGRTDGGRITKGGRLCGTRRRQALESRGSDGLRSRGDEQGCDRIDKPLWPISTRENSVATRSWLPWHREEWERCI